MPPKLFITHSWRDLAFAQRLFDDLRQCGFEGFLDAYSVRPGDDIAGRVSRGLEECDIYVTLLSPAALESPWCELELNTAINLSMERGRNGRPRIIPLVIAPCKVPTLLKGRLYISFVGRYAEALDELLTKGFGESRASYDQEAVGHRRQERKEPEQSRRQRTESTVPSLSSRLRQLTAILILIVGLAITFWAGTFASTIIYVISGYSSTNQWHVVYMVVVWLIGLVLTVIISRRVYRGS